jgi:chain length determinant protein tyrosine kinase EpsG
MSQLDIPLSTEHDLGHAVDVPEEFVEREIIATTGMSPRQVRAARSVQHRHHLSFAEAAIAIGLIRREDLLLALSKHYHYPLLSTAAESQRFSRELVVGFEPFGPQAEAVRSIRAAVAASALEAKTNSIAIVGPRSGVGASYLAANLAVAFAQAAAPTLLVDANLRKPRIAKMFGVDRRVEGLADALNYRVVDEPQIVHDLLPGLSILPAGSVPPNPQELLSSPDFANLVATLRRRQGVVVYDTTDAAECADGLIVATRVGAAVIVARRHKTAFAETAKLAATLRSHHCVILGSVLDG